MSDRFADRLLRWHRQHGRHDLPWQHPRSAYRVWLSEVMLQQTQVATVISYFERFVAALPNLPALAAAGQDQVLALWSGLGYYSRARNLHRAAKLCMQAHGGELPRDLDALMALPGIGRSTAGAILAQAHGLGQPILDGNVKRLLCRFHGVEGWPGLASVQKQLWRLAESHLPDGQLADYTQAQMDLGATVCRRSNPDCAACPLVADCSAHSHSMVEQLPTRKPTRTIPVRETFMLLVDDAAGRVLLQRRPQSGIWAGLWSLPEAASQIEAQRWSSSLLRQPKEVQAPQPFVHVFSHYRLQITPSRWRCQGLCSRISENDDARWFRIDELTSIGLPAPVRRLLLQAID